MTVLLKRCLRNKFLGDSTSPLLYYLKPEPGSFRIRTLSDISKDIELTGALSREDVNHVIHAATRRIKAILTDGDKVKMDGLGTFYITFNCKGTEEEKDCTVRNIHKVNIRFKADPTLRLVNESTATTRGADNNVRFAIKGETTTTDAGVNPGGNDSGGGGDEFIDPSA
ncbi:HU family DNA-binding protein [Bacteroides sp. 224]|uniref:HU family DNA-binding protein n=1 Tax=Bacteroides sp. 224 TaxID=2302936 RepID=UPI0013D40F86|nr:HU family DNA-binding protein [Bacteroides sp. 224]NDV63692.1 DNA-binding protein [Bacteroides sp. 224]